MNPRNKFTLSCPIMDYGSSKIILAHGSGGKLSYDLVEKMFVNTFSEKSLKECGDSVVLDFPYDKLAFTTDSFVVSPLVFPGGDIGTLAVNGTVNDLAMSGAKPLYLSLGFILEEGLDIELLWQITQSIKSAARKAGVEVVTGDTKVVDKGKGDGIFINTSGIGVVKKNKNISPFSIKENDIIIINGDIARHGMAIMALREGMDFEGNIDSDCAPLSAIVENLLDNDIDIHCMRDLTRGGLATALNEISISVNGCFEINEKDITVREDVNSACEILGLDPLYVANEGRFIIFAPESSGEKILNTMKKHEDGKGASVIGRVKHLEKDIVTVKNNIGTARIADMLTIDQLPRIC